MKNLRLLIRFACLFALLVIGCFATQAQTRTFVSGLGSDANPCTRISPCRNFQRAHDVVNFGGEVIAVDAADYGPLIITKSVTILGDGVYAGVSTTSGSGVTIATAGVTVNLRWLIIEGLGSADFGIFATDFAALHIENCIVKSFVQNGINVVPASSGTRQVFIKDSISKDNGINGIILNNFPDGSPLRGTIEGTRAENNGFHGIVGNVTGTVITAHECLSSGNLSDGFQSADGAVLNIERSVASNNGQNGIHTIGVTFATVRVSNSTVTSNILFGFSNQNGTLESRGNNTVAGNNGGGVQTLGTITPLTAL